jgi:predicted transposase/invertase (TIGR01784 family)
VGKKDIISKDITKTIIKDISTYILKLDIKEIEYIDKESQRIENREADILAKVNSEYILHLEIQSSYDSFMPYRMLRYFSDIKLNKKLHKYPVKQYLINLSNKNIKNYIDEFNYSFDIIDLKSLDCEYFMNLDTPDGIVLAILCDFKDKNKNLIVENIIRKLHHLVEDEKEYRKYFSMLEELSTLRDLKEVIKESEMRLSDITYKDLPSYEIGWEQGVREGRDFGLQKGKVETAIMMIKSFKLPINEVAKKLNISQEELLNKLKD